MANRSLGGLGRRQTGTDLVFERLKTAIVEGALRPDERLVELSLSDDLNISRTPLRHALQRLEAEGWVARAQNGRIRVLGVSEKELEALYVVRAALEDLVLQEIGSSLRPDDIARLRAILEDQSQLAKIGDLVRVAASGESFHKTLWQISANRVCQEFLEDIYEKTKRYRRLGFAEGKFSDQGTREHWKIFRCLTEGNIAEARRRLCKHLERSRDRAKASFRQWAELPQAPSRRR